MAVSLGSLAPLPKDLPGEPASFRAGDVPAGRLLRFSGILKGRISIP